MFTVNEVAPNGQSTGPTQSQAQVIASVIALQRVIAGRSGAESGDASARDFSGNAEKYKLVRSSDRNEAAKADTNATAEQEQSASSDQSAEARSIIEAQEASLTDRKLTAAFHARHGLTDLLSVIRDPEDRMLPTAPKEN